MKLAVTSVLASLVRARLRAMCADFSGQDPQLQPLWRRLLGVRVLVALPIVTWLFQAAVGWIDRHNALHPFPHQVERAWSVMVAASLIALLFSTAFALHDIVVCLVPRGTVRRLLLLGDEESAAREALASNGALVWKILVFPLLVPIAVLALGALGSIAFGGRAPLVAEVSRLLEARDHWVMLSAGAVTPLLLKR